MDYTVAHIVLGIFISTMLILCLVFMREDD